MLVLTRKLNEEIVIDGDIVVRVVALVDGKVGLGIKAPADVEIHRREVQDQITAGHRRTTRARSAA